MSEKKCIPQELLWALALPLAICSLAIYPDSRYLLPLSVILALKLLESVRLRDSKISPYFAALVGSAALVFTPSYGAPDRLVAVPFHHVQASTLTPNRATIIFIRSLGLNRAAALLSADGRHKPYLPNDFTEVELYQKNLDDCFKDFMSRRNIDIVVVSQLMQSDLRLQNDRSWAEFLRDPDSAGFVKFRPENTDRLILVKKVILK